LFARIAACYGAVACDLRLVGARSTHYLQVKKDISNRMVQSPDSTVEDSDPSAWVEAHGDVLYRYALARVRKPEVAEDLVQETFLAALKARERFEGRSSMRTWLVGILRHKLLDHYRKRSKGPEETGGSHEDFLADFFDARGNWLHSPDAEAVRPDALLEREEFWDTFDRCLDGLPVRAREAFVLRVIENEDTKSVCKTLGVSATNLYVLLFRARTRMRRCLTVNWFERDGASGDARRESGPPC